MVPNNAPARSTPQGAHSKASRGPNSRSRPARHAPLLVPGPLSFPGLGIGARVASSLVLTACTNSATYGGLGAGVGLYGDFAGIAELLDDPVISVPLDDPLDVRQGVSGRDDEAIGDDANPLILPAGKGDACSTGHVSALAEQLDRLVGAALFCDFGDGLVDVAQESLVRSQLVLAHTQGLAPFTTGNRGRGKCTPSPWWELLRMILVEIIDDVLRESLGSFLDASFPGDTFDRETGFAIDFRAPGLSPEMEMRLAERLLWAWQAQEDAAKEIELLLTASPSGSFAGKKRPATIQRRIHFTA